MLETYQLTYGTPTGRILQKDLTLSIYSGQLLLITGSNGCGKSTLLRTILGENTHYWGHVSINVPNSRKVYLPQLENTEIHLPLTLLDVLTISQSRKLSEESVLRFGLLKEEHLGIAWNSASGGERKRTLLTRALMQNPSMMIFDEPMNHLDRKSRAAMISVMASFLKEQPDRSIVMVCHQGLKPEERTLFDVTTLDLDRGTDAEDPCSN
ncbi:ATP-binding cassette domain-containing protein [bacterium]|nr:ATP-binding cassette domain-containing protein [bacterium]